MLFISDWLTLVLFWLLIARLYRSVKARTVLVFVSLWFGGYFATSLLGIEGPIYFISYKALLCIDLLFIDLYLRKMGKRIPPENPFDEIQD